MSTKEESARIELLQGTLDLLILRTLAPGPPMAMPSPKPSSASPKTCCRWSKVRSTRPCTG